MAVSTEVEQDVLLFAGLFGDQRLVDRSLDSVRRLWSWDDPLGARK